MSSLRERVLARGKLLKKIASEQPAPAAPTSDTTATDAATPSNSDSQQRQLESNTATPSQPATAPGQSASAGQRDAQQSQPRSNSRRPSRHQSDDEPPPKRPDVLRRSVRDRLGTKTPPTQPLGPDDSRAMGYTSPATGAPPLRQSSQAAIDAVLSAASHRDQQTQKSSARLYSILGTPSVKEQVVAQKFQSAGAAVREFCEYNTFEECKRATRSNRRCGKLHFVRIIRPFTDVQLGDCSFLNHCFNPDKCKYVHYAIDPVDARMLPRPTSKRLGGKGPSPEQSEKTSLVKTTLDATDMRTYPAQWIQCDVRLLDFEVLGKFSVIMADPPWDIHMELPYGTMEDSEMRRLKVGQLQDDGYIFLWVTHRAMELGRACLREWGYRRVDELVWIKTNQLQKLIRTGRTGHWMNHAKEHCLIGVKGNPQNINRDLDCDVLVAEVRDTSHKPDEIYGLIERLSPGTRKLEIFGRQHNVQKNWVTLGNQLQGVHLVDPEMIERFKQRYRHAPEQTQRLLLTGRLEDGGSSNGSGPAEKPPARTVTRTSDTSAHHRR